MISKDSKEPPAASQEVRARLVDALKLDLVGPWTGHTLMQECLPGWVRPSSWYLTGFLIPSGTPPEKSADVDEDDDMGEIPSVAGLAEESNEERKAAKKGFFPSSIGLSFLISKETCTIRICVRWGDYEQAETSGEEGKPIPIWKRKPREKTIEMALDGHDDDPIVRDVPDSGGLQLHVVERQIIAEEIKGIIPSGTRSVSVFLVNRRPPNNDIADLSYVFQAEIEVRGDCAFVARPDLNGANAEDWDEQVADLHYDETPEYATGHGISAEWEMTDGACRLLRSAWIPSAEVEKTITADIEGVELSMEVLGELTDGSAVNAALNPLVTCYREWIAAR